MSLVIRNGNKIVAQLSYGSISLQYPCSNTTKCSPFTAKASPGKYRIEVWGAEGGYIREGDGKLSGGGYSTGVLSLNHSCLLFIHLGGRGQYYGNQTMSGGNNGGGPSFFLNRTGETVCHASGGGASDVRVALDDFNHRLIVAGGGGSQGKYELQGRTYFGKGGFGGGLQGGDGEWTINTNPGFGGTQISSQGTLNLGSFGKGGDRGGGGGWYGGSGSWYGNGCGGGSGFIFTSKKNTPSSFLLSSGYFLSEAETIGGNETIPPYSGKPQIGHHDNGCIRITILDSFTSHNYFCSSRPTPRSSIIRMSICVFYFLVSTK